MKRWIFAAAAVLSSLVLQADSVDRTVKATEFGFDPADATECLQKAIDSGAEKILVEKQSSPWIISKTIRLRSDQTIFFMDGCEVLAKEGAFKGQGEHLFTAKGCNNVVLQGVGKARIAMRRSDYANRDLYPWSEWRHAISFYECENIRVTDLTIEESGGDGIYLGSTKEGKPCRSITIENLKCNRHYRQGISIISAVDVVIRNCQFNDTKGTPPAAGIDLEPNKKWNELKDIFIERCEFNGNQGGILIYCGAIKASNVRNVTVYDCNANNNAGYGLRIVKTMGDAMDRTDDGPGVLVRKCSFSGNGTNGLALARFTKGGFPVVIRGCTFNCTKGSRAAFSVDNSEGPGDLAGITLEQVAFQPGKGGEMQMYRRPGYGILPGAVSMDFTMARNGKAEAFDWAAFVKANAPDTEMQKFPVADFRAKRLSPVSKKAVPAAEENVLELRGRGHFVQYLGDQGGELKLRFLRRQIGTADKRPQITVRDAIGTILDTKEIPADDYTYTFRTDKRVCVVEVDSCKAGLKVFSDRNGCGWVAQNPLPLIGKTSKSYFVVPKGTKVFAVNVSGNPGEPVTAELRDPSGNVRAKVEGTEGTATLKVTQEASTAPRVWELNILNAREDYSVQLGAPLTPVLSASPQTALTQDRY